MTRLSRCELVIIIFSLILVNGFMPGNYTLQAETFSNTADSAITKVNLSAAANPRPEGNWVMSFSDEFNGTGAPDPAKWDRPEYNRRNNPNGPDGWWEQDDTYMEAGNLVIRIRRMPDRNNDGDLNDYNVGAIRTLGHFEQTYGKYEIRAKLPSKQGWWVAFWMMQGNVGSVGNGGVDGSEVDIMEAFGWTDKINHAVHWDGYAAEHKSVGQAVSHPGIREGFHTYTMIWDPDMYYFYVDSVEVWRTTGGGVCNKPGYVKLTGECSTESWAVNDYWAKDPAGAAYPDYFLVDWVRVYKETTVDVKKTSGSLLPDFELKQNYPNPFNPTTTISYSIPKESHVELKVYDMLGRVVSTLVNKEQVSEEHKVQFNGEGLPSGIYIYTIHAGDYRASKRLMILK